MRRISARLLPCTHMPGPGYEGLLARVDCESALTMSMAFSGASRAVLNSVSDTFIGQVVPIITRRLARVGAPAAASSAISEPMLWPTHAACATPAVSSSASAQPASASTLASGGPALRPWPG